MHHRTESIRFKPDLNLEEGILEETAGICGVLPQRDSRNTFEQGPHRPRTKTHLSIKHDLDHNQTRWNPQVPHARGNTRANSGTNGSVDDKKPVRKTVDNLKRDDDMTTSCHARDTAGRGRSIFSNTNGDVPMSILQQKHTANTDNNDNCHSQHDHNRNNAKLARHSSNNKKGGQSLFDVL